MAGFFSVGAFLGVLAGVGSMPVEREIVELAVWRVEALSSMSRDLEKLWEGPSKAIAADMRDFFFGDSNGDTMPADDDVWVRVVFAGPKGSGLEVELRGGGVLVRWAEMRADLRGENGSQPSPNPCLGVGGVCILPGGEGVDGAMAGAIVIQVWSAAAVTRFHSRASR